MGSVHPSEAARTRSLDLCLASVTFHLESPSDEVLHQCAQRYRNFLYPRRGAFEILLDSSAPQPSPAEAWEAPQVERWRQEWRLAVHQAQAELDLTRGRAVIHGRLSVFTFDSFLRIFLSLLLLEKDGLLLHAATVQQQGRAHTFMGRSGAGKSTVAALAPPDSVLTDEISLLRLVEGEPRAYGSPFWGGLAGSGQPGELPLAALYVLVKDRRSFCERLRGAQAIAALSAHTLFFFPDAEMFRSLLHLWTRWVEAVPVYRLHFLPNHTVWDALEAGSERSAQKRAGFVPKRVDLREGRMLR